MNNFYRCNVNDASMCMVCTATKFLSDNKCAAACPDFSYQATDYGGNVMEV